MSLAYPLTITFGVETFRKRIRVTDTNGQLIVQAHAKLTSVKEDFTLFADEHETQPLYRIRRNDFAGISYSIETLDGEPRGTVMLSTAPMLSPNTYDLIDASNAKLAQVHAADRWVELTEFLLGDIPIVDYIVFWLLKPSYLFDDANGTTLSRLRVMPSVGERSFLLQRESLLTARLEQLAIPVALIVTLIERGH